MGYKVNGTTIQITRGDSGYFAFTPYAMDENGEWSVYQPLLRTQGKFYH